MTSCTVSVTALTVGRASDPSGRINTTVRIISWRSAIRMIGTELLRPIIMSVTGATPSPWAANDRVTAVSMISWETAGSNPCWRNTVRIAAP